MKIIKMCLGVFAAVFLVLAFTTMISSDARHIASSKIAKIQNTIKLNNALDILEGKHIQNVERYKTVTRCITEIKYKISTYNVKAERIKAKINTNDYSVQEYCVYTNTISCLSNAVVRLEDAKARLKYCLEKHDSYSSMLKAKVETLNTLKNLVSYGKDTNPNSDDGIERLIDDAISSQDIELQVLDEVEHLKNEFL